MLNKLKACKETGKLCMIFTASPDEAKRYMNRGFDAVAHSIDTIMFKDVYKRMVEDIREG